MEHSTRPELTSERKAWLQGLKPGDEVWLYYTYQIDFVTAFSEPLTLTVTRIDPIPADGGSINLTEKNKVRLRDGCGRTGDSFVVPVGQNPPSASAIAPQSSLVYRELGGNEEVLWVGSTRITLSHVQLIDFECPVLAPIAKAPDDIEVITGVEIQLSSRSLTFKGEVAEAIRACFNYQTSTTE